MTFPQLFTPLLFSFHIYASILQSPGSKKSETSMDQRDSIILTPKNVQASRKQARCFLQLYHDPFFFWHIFRLVSFWTQALRTLFNVAHRLHNVLGPSWVLVSNCVPFFLKKNWVSWIIARSLYPWNFRYWRLFQHLIELFILHMLPLRLQSFVLSLLIMFVEALLFS